MRDWRPGARRLVTAGWAACSSLGTGARQHVLRGAGGGARGHAVWGAGGCCFVSLTVLGGIQLGLLVGVAPPPAAQAGCRCPLAPDRQANCMPRTGRQSRKAPSTRPSPAPQTACPLARGTSTSAPKHPAANLRKRHLHQAQAGCPLAPSSSQNSIHQHPAPGRQSRKAWWMLICKLDGEVSGGMQFGVLV